MVRKVPSKLWDACLVVVSVLRVELYVAVTVQKHQLNKCIEKQIVTYRPSVVKMQEKNKDFKRSSVCCFFFNLKMVAGEVTAFWL